MYLLFIEVKFHCERIIVEYFVYAYIYQLFIACLMFYK